MSDLIDFYKNQVRNLAGMARWLTPSDQVS